MSNTVQSQSPKSKVQDPKPRVLAVASFGGHLVQLLRIVSPLLDDYEVAFVSSAQEAAPSIPDGHDFDYVQDFSRTKPWMLLTNGWRFRKIIRKFRPDVLITTGAAPGLAALLVAKMMGVRTLWIDSIANAEKLSMCGSIASRIADSTLTQWPQIANDKVEYHGTVL